MLKTTATSPEEGTIVADRMPATGKPTLGSAPIVLPLVAELCLELDRAGVVYCHWKSNNALDRSASGENDLDLLIARPDISRFTEILCRLGFKEVQAPATKQVPGILNYYGHEPSCNHLVHVHAHYQLIVGHDMTKNYHLPIERPYLASRREEGIFPVPTAEWELILLIVRMVLKHCTWDTILARQGRLKSGERRELDYLLSRAAWHTVEQHLAEHVEMLDGEFLKQCLEALAPQASFGARVSAGRALQRRLAGQAVMPVWHDVTLKITRRVTRKIRSRIGVAANKKRFAQGGAVIAVVGGDGAGKSTSIESLYAWLAGDFATQTFHLGKPRWSLTTGVIRAAGKLLSYLPATAKADAPPSIGLLLRKWTLARDRYRCYLRARRFASTGGVSICDRFPLATVEVMDGASARRLAGDRSLGQVAEWLIAGEETFYRRMITPEILVGLKLDPEVAVARALDRDACEDAEAVRMRNQALWNANWSGVPLQVVDAGQSKSAVLAQLKRVIWSNL